MYRVKGSAGLARTSFGTTRAARLRWWAAAAGLAVAVLAVFTAVTLWLGFSVTAAAPPTPAPARDAEADAGTGANVAHAAARPHARQASSESSQEASVRETAPPPSSTAAPPASPSAAPPTPAINYPPASDGPSASAPSDPSAGEADSHEAAAAEDASATAGYDEEDESVLVPTGEEAAQPDPSEQRFYVDEGPDATTPSARAAQHRHLAAPPTPRPLPQTPTATATPPMDTQAAPTQPPLPATPPTRFELGAPVPGAAPAAQRENAPPTARTMTFKDLAMLGFEARRKELLRAPIDAPQVRKIGFMDRPGLRPTRPIDRSVEQPDLADPLPNYSPPEFKRLPEANPFENIPLGSAYPELRKIAEDSLEGQLTDAESEELKKHLLNEIKAARGRDRLLMLSESTPSDEQLNEFLLREMTKDSRREDLVQREISQVEGVNLLRRQGDVSSTQYMVQEKPSTQPAAAALLGAGASGMGSFLQKRVQDLHDWLGGHAKDGGVAVGGGVGGGGDSGGNDLRGLLSALNQSLALRDARPVLARLRELYERGGGAPGGPSAALRDSDSLLALGLLAFDLLLLRNVQQIAWGEEPAAGRAMLQDPEVAALNALFIDPTRLRAQDPVLAALDADPGMQAQDLTLLEEVVEFVKSAARALLSLGRAYRGGGGVLDCVWTLYCRNLDKTARMHGPYGFLARLNGLGLRLLMGEFPLETALDTMLHEMAHGWTGIDCATFFPRCSPEKATGVVLRQALGAASEELLAQGLNNTIPTVGLGNRVAAAPTPRVPTKERAAAPAPAEAAAPAAAA